MTGTFTYNGRFKCIYCNKTFGNLSRAFGHYKRDDMLGCDL